VRTRGVVKRGIFPVRTVPVDPRGPIRQKDRLSATILNKLDTQQQLANDMLLLEDPVILDWSTLLEVS
jgi:hypothetical protein